MKNIFFKFKKFFFSVSIPQMMLITVIFGAIMLFLARLGVPVIDYIVLFVGIPIFLLLWLLEGIIIFYRYDKMIKSGKGPWL